MTGVDAGAIMTAPGPDGSCRIVGVLRTVPSGRDVDSDFAVAWRRYLAGNYGREPAMDIRFEYHGAGYPGRYGSASADRLGVVTLYVLRARGVAMPVAVLANTAGVRNDHSVLLEQFLDGVRLSPERAEPVNRTVQMADLVGEWHEGGDSSVNWVDVYGNYAATTFVAHGVTYDIAADGTFHSSFAGISNGKILREKATGRIDLQRDLLARCCRNAANARAADTASSAISGR